MTLRLRIKLVPAMVLSLLSVAIVPSLAQTTEQQLPQKVNCANPQTTIEMDACAGQEYQAADKKLNQVYRQLQSKLSGQQRQRITYAQLAWIRFRDANCAYEKGQFEAGTVAGPTNSSCLARMTQQRAKELEDYLQSLNQ